MLESLYEGCGLLATYMTTVIILMTGLRNIGYLRFGIHIAIAIALWIGVVGGIGYFCADALRK